MIGGKAVTVGRTLAAAALQQGFQIAEIDNLVRGEIDEKLLTALATAGDDRVLRYEAFFLVLAAMDGRTNANGMEADSTVRNAWTLLHCRESWECDLDATLDFMSPEMPMSSLTLAIDLATELDVALANRDFSSIRLH
ncbi:MAG: hypothetical protein WD944_06945 [Steroidobacteraceae bacterium]